MTEGQEYRLLYALARKKGWHTPSAHVFGKRACIDYWRACEAYENGQSEGRPVRPHRSA